MAILDAPAPTPRYSAFMLTLPFNPAPQMGDEIQPVLGNEVKAGVICLLSCFIVATSNEMPNPLGASLVGAAGFAFGIALGVSFVHEAKQRLDAHRMNLIADMDKAVQYLNGEIRVNGTSGIYMDPDSVFFYDHVRSQDSTFKADVIMKIYAHKAKVIDQLGWNKNSPVRIAAVAAFAAATPAPQ